MKRPSSYEEAAAKVNGAERPAAFEPNRPSKAPSSPRVAIARAILDAVGQETMPESIVHLALEAHGATPEQSAWMIRGMVSAGLLCRIGDQIKATGLRGGL
jgi:hypothetical protein